MDHHDFPNEPADTSPLGRLDEALLTLERQHGSEFSSELVTELTKVGRVKLEAGCSDHDLSAALQDCIKSAPQQR